jgi:hypothetical protein
MLERRSLLELVVAVDLAALCILASILLAGVGEQPAMLVLLGGLAAAVSMRPIRLRKLKLQVAPIDAFVLTALATLGPLAAILVGFLGNVAAAVGGGRRKALPRFAFNSGATMLAVGTAWWVFWALAPATRQATVDLVFPLCAAASALYVVTSMLVAAPIAIERRRSYLTTLGSTLLWSAPHALLGLALALTMLFLLGFASIWTLLLAVIPCWLLAFMHRLHASRRGLADRLAG